MSWKGGYGSGDAEWMYVRRKSQGCTRVSSLDEADTLVPLTQRSDTRGRAELWVK